MARDLAPLSPQLQQTFSQLVVARTGIKIRENDQEAFARILTQRLQGLGLSFPEEYYHLLSAATPQADAEWAILLAKITNAESFFFRDKGQFGLLARHILPELLRASETKTLRLCSAGCSTGEEPYSLAILLHQLIPDLRDWDISIVGIDINSAVIERARAGIYRPWSFRGLAPETKAQFFTEKNGLYHLCPEIRAMVTFQTVNLLQDDFEHLERPLVDLDLILCRNVFIYFSDEAIAQVLRQFHRALQPAGYLLVGHAELHSQAAHPFAIQLFEESVAYQPRPSQSLPVRVHPRRSRPAPSSTHLDPAEQLKRSDSKMQQTAIGLLKQLPGDMRLPKLGNLTAAELIAQLEQTTESPE